MHDFENEARAAAAPVRRDKEAGVGESRPASVGADAASLLHLQRTAGNAGVLQMFADDEAEERSPVHDVVGGGGGSPLDKATRATMESRLGADFGDVRVHTDAQASRSAEAVGANAYTVGSDIVFRSGHFDPGSATGQRTIAHELTHVVQQKSGPVDGTMAPGGIRLSDPSDRYERAAEALSTTAVQTETDTSEEAPSVQRATDVEDDEDLEGSDV
jgi:uncharacterized protein DUF4157